jgi:hypothetical protein
VVVVVAGADVLVDPRNVLLVLVVTVVVVATDVVVGPGCVVVEVVTMAQASRPRRRHARSTSRRHWRRAFGTVSQIRSPTQTSIAAGQAAAHSLRPAACAEPNTATASKRPIERASTAALRIEARISSHGTSLLTCHIIVRARN